MKKFECLNVKIDDYVLEQILEKIPEFLSSPKQHRIVTVNAEYVLEAQKDREFRDIINSADLRIADGIGLIWATKFLSLPASKYKILRYPQVVIQYMCTGASLVFWNSYCKSVIQERVSGIDILKSILENPEKIRNQNPENYQWIRDSGFRIRIFLIGGFNNASEKIKEKYPDTNIIGTFEGSPNTEDDEEAREAINRARPNVLFVAYGNPASKQEKWISRNLPYLPSVKLAMGVGGSFDFLSGQVKRAPKFMRKLGIEWLWRVIRQPRRVKRIWNAVVAFSFKVLQFKISPPLEGGD